MDTLKQWLGWIIFCGIIPTIAILFFARYMRQHELNYYLIVSPLLLVYFYILGKLKLDISGIVSVRKGSPSDVVGNFLGFEITAGQLLGEIISYLRGIVIFFVMPILGTGLIFYGVRDHEIMGYVLGPCMIWVSGGFWSSFMRFLSERREARQTD